MDMRGRYKRSAESRKKSAQSRNEYFKRDETARAKIALNTKKQWSDPSTRKTIIAGVRKSRQGKNLRETLSKKATERWKDSEFRKRVIPLMSGKNNHRYNPDRSQVLHRNGRGFLKSQVKRLLKEKCDWCGSEKNLQLDHIMPVCAGGNSDDSNAQTLCVKCNNRKRITIDAELMKSYRIRGNSNRVMPRTIPSQATFEKTWACVETMG